MTAVWLMAIWLMGHPIWLSSEQFASEAACEHVLEGLARVEPRVDNALFRGCISAIVHKGPGSQV